MQYPLPESIGDPDLLVGRQLEFSILDEWISLIPRRASRSMAILARRKSGKTAILQRIFNRLWSENGEVIPFYKYAEFYRQPITNTTALQINRLCMSDPFFISCVMQSVFPGKDLSTEPGVVDTVHYEITEPSSEMSTTWGEYIELSLKRINTVNSKHILLHLSKHSDRYWTPRELKRELGLDIETDEIKTLLQNMVKADLIQRGPSDIDFRGLTDGTLCLVLRNRFEKEIQTHQPDIKKDFHEELARLKKEKKSGLVLTSATFKDYRPGSRHSGRSGILPGCR